ncbi:Putative NAD(P)H nitroreductase [Defluviimonas aquaemixtae]|uniref:NAD(P)H nitroreductase n=1 Tax=Albidovulum aquaemixtae TaxID=1542388 RepID=A0A2R8BL52_9RHOB|nr:twin-arginine translocation pathway signal protein [Defluviimonas aquaemixtae]SPH24109.1 Putative NAD(P)H nitroreductase [Defluviimonas aquaemixtae]
MSIPRRKFLTLIGGGTILAAGAAGLYAGTRTPTAALTPWNSAGRYDDPRLRALSYALLAPNPHNRQPWVARLDGADGLTLFRDPTRNLPETDPFDRQLTIGMGCFLELMVQAAAEEATGVALNLFPEGTGPKAPVAHARFTGPAAPDPLFAQVMHRHTNRKPYDMARPVAEADIAAILGAATDDVRADGTGDAESTQRLRDLTLAAIIVETETPRTHHESVRLMRIGKAEIETSPDGISVGGPLPDALGRLGLLTRESMADPGSSTFAQTIDMFRTAFAATPAFFWLATPGNARTDQIAAGRSWVRAHLQATALGLAVQPVSQALQEYPEMADHRAEVHALCARGGETLQMLGRLGYGPKQGPAPRWPLETRLVDA